jgi:hypothetical protein
MRSLGPDWNDLADVLAWLATALLLLALVNALTRVVPINPQFADRGSQIARQK